MEPLDMGLGVKMNSIWLSENKLTAADKHTFAGILILVNYMKMKKEKCIYHYTASRLHKINNKTFVKGYKLSVMQDE